MKKIILITITIFAFGAFNLNAQDLKFAHVKSDSVLTNIESYKSIVKEQTQIEKDYQKMYESIQKQIMNIQNEAAVKQDSIGLSQFEIDMYSSDLEKKQYDLQNLEVKTQQSLQVLQQRMEKLMIMYREAVAKVAAAQGITYVFDESQQLLYAGPKSQDITEEVKAELIKMDEASPVHRYP